MTRRSGRPATPECSHPTAVRTAPRTDICILPYPDRHWRYFFRVAGRPELAEDPRLADAETRSRHVAELYALVAECVRDRPSAYWIAEIEDLFTRKIAIEAAPDQSAAAKTAVGTRST